MLPEADNNNNNNNHMNSARLANAWVKKKASKTFPMVSYPPDLNMPGLDTKCVICLSKFVTGEWAQLLPKCNHGFNVRCIDKWPNSHSSCPTRRHCLIETREKIVGYCQAGPSLAGVSSAVAATTTVASSTRSCHSCGTLRA